MLAYKCTSHKETGVQLGTLSFTAAVAIFTSVQQFQIEAQRRENAVMILLLLILLQVLWRTHHSKS